MAAHDSIILANEFDSALLEYGEVKRLDNGGKVIYVNYNKRPLLLQTPECYAPFGLSCFQGEEGKPDAYSIDLSFRDMSTRDCLQHLHRMMTSIDEQNKAAAQQNAMAWMRKKAMSDELVGELYTPIIKRAKDKETGDFTDKFPATFKIKVPTAKDGSFRCSAFDTSHNPFDIKSTSLKGAKVKALVQCTGIWVAGAKFGMSWKLVQMQVVPRLQMDSYCMRSVKDHCIDDDEDDDNEIVALPPKRVAKSNESEPMSEDDTTTTEPVVEDEDEVEEEEEEEDEEEEEEEPQVVAPPKRRTKKASP